MRDIIAIVPARGGSKGIRQKNIRMLGGLPLLGWTLRACKLSQKLTRIIVSTEDDYIKQIASQYEVEILKRPQELAEDHVHAIEVILYILDEQKINDDAIISMLLPTSPFRTWEHIDRSIKLLENNPHYSSVIGLEDISTEVRLRYIDENSTLQMVLNREKNVQRQEAREIYHVNGAIFVSQAGKLREYKTFHIDGARPFIMDKEASVEIDTYEDYFLAQRLVRS